MDTIVGPIKFGPDGNWAESRIVMAQYRGVADKNIDQFRQPGKADHRAAGGFGDREDRDAL